MKITDFAILAGAMLAAVLWGWNYRTDVLRHEMAVRTNINDVMDEAVRDVLECSFTDTDIEGKPVIDRYSITDKLADEVSYVFFGNTHEKSIGRVKNMLRACFLITGDTMYVYEFGEYVSQVYLGEEGSGRNAAAISAIESVIGADVLLPYNDGEDYIQKIGEYSYTAVVVRNGRHAVFSSASIKEIVS